MEQAIERLAAIAFLITGVSHIAAPRAWSQLFVRIREEGESAGLINALIHLPTGLAIVAFHPVWRGWPLVVTLLGAALVAKGAAYAIWPRLAQIGMARVEEAWRFRAGGVGAVLIGALCGWISTLPR